jgi:hypothetical protein
MATLHSLYLPMQQHEPALPARCSTPVKAAASVGASLRWLHCGLKWIESEGSEPRSPQRETGE